MVRTLYKLQNKLQILKQNLKTKIKIQNCTKSKFKI